MIQCVVNQRVTKYYNMVERETLKLLQIDVLTNIIPYNMDKMTPTPPLTADVQRFVVTSPENFFFFFLTY